MGDIPELQFSTFIERDIEHAIADQPRRTGEQGFSDEHGHCPRPIENQDRIRIGRKAVEAVAIQKQILNGDIEW